MVFPAGFRAPRGNLSQPELRAKHAFKPTKADESLVQHRLLDSGVLRPNFKNILESKNQPSKQRHRNPTHIPTYVPTSL